MIKKFDNFDSNQKLLESCGGGISSCGNWGGTEDSTSRSKKIMKKRASGLSKVFHKEYCEECGEKLIKDAKFCHECGNKI